MNKSLFGSIGSLFYEIGIKAPHFQFAFGFDFALVDVAAGLLLFLYFKGDFEVLHWKL